MEAKATFAGGCFWCMQPSFDNVEGVISTFVGYMGGQLPHPTYEQVSSGETGHAEAIQVLFDPEKISYQKLLDIFWHTIDPTTRDQQFCDIGHQYRTAIFYHDEIQHRLAEQSKEDLITSHRFDAVVTEILPATKFYPAEEHHQNYYKTNPYRYKLYHYMSGREERLSALWKNEKGESAK